MFCACLSIYHNLEVQKYIFVLTSSKMKINIAKIRTKSHELHSEMGCCTIPKTPWVERTCHLCETTSIKDESHFLFDCLAYNHIRSQFHYICYNANLPNLLTCQNYGDLGTLISYLFERQNKILQQSKQSSYKSPCTFSRMPPYFIMYIFTLRSHYVFKFMECTVLKV